MRQRHLLGFLAMNDGLALAERVREAKRVYVVGNGGSYANAQHVVNDLVACGVKAFTIDGVTLSCLANDGGWEGAWARWLEVVGEPGDLLIAMSGSGTSPNILRAVEQAEKIGMAVWREYGAAQGLGMEAAEERQVWLGHEVKRRLMATGASRGEPRWAYGVGTSGMGGPGSPPIAGARAAGPHGDDDGRA